MNDEERNELVKKSFENVLKKLANNPEELMDNHKLQIKYNNVLKEKIKLQSNWNNLRKWLEGLKNYEEMKDKMFYIGNIQVLQDVLDKMNELEGDNNGIMDKKSR